MQLSTKQIMEIIPHRQPFLLLDTIEELEPGVRAVGKTVSYTHLDVYKRQVIILV